MRGTGSRGRGSLRGVHPEKGTGLWVISQVGSHKSWGRTGGKADGDDSSTFSQRRSWLWAVMACRAGVLVQRRPWRGRGETEGGLGHWMVCF